MEKMIPWMMGVWSLAAVVWWGLALWLVRRRVSAETNHADTSPDTTDLPSLSIFKALPPLFGRAVPPGLVDALDTFVRQLDDACELLLGIEEADRPSWEPVIAAWRRKYPRARLVEVCAPRPAQFISPKVSWYHTLSQHAAGKCWMWSDADMIAPDGFLRAVRGDLQNDGAALVTAPYMVRRLTTASTIWEAVFANVEFYPGVLACERFGAIKFGFGACLLFSAEAFRARLDWARLGSRIADDNLVGQTLQPARLCSVTMETLAADKKWSDAILHYLRWHKTVRWCRPIGFAGQIMIVPLLGWIGAGAVQPGTWWTWAGLVAMWQIEVLAAVGLFRLAQCRMNLCHVVALQLWPWVRALTWVACWFPWPVVFASQGRKWWSLYRCSAQKTEGASERGDRSLPR
jgi:ceramide glucosyltransferase